MATKFKPNKKGVITGTAQADRITWTSARDWMRALTVNAGKGNDIIDFRKSRYSNKLNGQDGNDKIYGGSNVDIINGGNGNDKLFGYNGNDRIYGGKGNDTINAGKGTNLIYINKNEGTDTILNGGGNDTIVFAQEKNFNSFIFYYVGNDLIFKAGNSIAKLKDFVYGNHSAKYIQAGNQKLKLSGQISQYVSMSANHYTTTAEGFNKELLFNNASQNLLMTNGVAAYIQGTSGNELYSGYTFANGKVTIHDEGSSGDALSLNMTRNDYRFFIDIDTAGKAASNDLIIYQHSNAIQEDGLFQYIMGYDVDEFIKIENEVRTASVTAVNPWEYGSGRIEAITDNDNPATGIDVQSYFNQIHNDVATWLTGFNTAHSSSYETVAQAIAGGQATLAECTSLYNLYCNDANFLTL
ncbi:hypothetical protein J6S88_02945 [bacterium]|nr:hypothetical protein [bacterium]